MLKQSVVDKNQSGGVKSREKRFLRILISRSKIHNHLF